MKTVLKMVECPECDGEGRKLREIAVRLDGARFAEQDWVDAGPCPACQGTGEIDQEDEVEEEEEEA